MSEEIQPETQADSEPAISDEPILLSTPGNPVPPKHIAGYFPGRDGISLRYAIFKCDIPVAKGTIVLLQGRNEFIEKYFETIRHFNDLGFWVATFDWRGQGGSDRILKKPLRGHVHRFADFEDDLDRFIETIVLPDTRLPFLLIAHSMGALVALSSAPRLANRIDKMVLLAPFIDLSDQKFSSNLIYWICRLMSLVGLGWMSFSSDIFPRPYDGNALTTDRARFDRNQNIYETWPRLRLGPPTVRWIAAMLGAMKRVKKLSHLNSIQVPTLLLAASADTIVSQQALEMLSNRFRAGAMIAFDGARHEILQEADRYRLPALAAIDAFILPDRDIPPRELVGITTKKLENDPAKEPEVT